MSDRSAIKFDGVYFTEAEIRDIATRTWTPTPKGPSHPPAGVPESAEARTNRKIENEWMREWATDRRDLRRALAEILDLRTRLRPVGVGSP